MLSFISDIFNKLNGIRSSLLGPSTTVFQFFDEVSSFVKNDAKEVPL